MTLWERYWSIQKYPFDSLRVCLYHFCQKDVGLEAFWVKDKKFWGSTAEEDSEGFRRTESNSESLQGPPTVNLEHWSLGGGPWSLLSGDDCGGMYHISGHLGLVS